MGATGRMDGATARVWAAAEDFAASLPLSCAWRRHNGYTGACKGVDEKEGVVMAHVTNFFGLLEQLQSADITVHQNRCAVVRNRNATCMKCAEVCTSGCISYDDSELIISPEKCIGCGTCATICPTCALEAHRPNDAELLQSCLSAARAAGGEVIIACEQILAAAEGLYDPEKVVGVGCLGRAEESLLVALSGAGVSHVRLLPG